MSIHSLQEIINSLFLILYLHLKEKKLETFLISRKHTRIMTKSMRAKIVNVNEISFKVYYFKDIHALKQNENGSYSFPLKQ